MGKGDRKAHNRKEGKRTPSGALSRSAEERQKRIEEAEKRSYENDPRQVVYQSRNRQRRAFRQPQNAEEWRGKNLSAVTKAQVKERKLEKRGSVLGRLLADGKLTEAQVSAGEDYCQRYITYATTNGLPPLTAKIGAYGDVRGGGRPERIQAAAAAKAQHMEDMRVLRRCSAGVVWAMRRACVKDEAAPLHLIREGLKALIDAGR